VFSILDTNKDGQLSRDEWNAYFDVFKQAESGWFAVSVPADSERGDMTTAHVLWRQKRGNPRQTPRRSITRAASLLFKVEDWRRASRR